MLVYPTSEQSLDLRQRQVCELLGDLTLLWDGDPDEAIAFSVRALLSLEEPREELSLLGAGKCKKYSLGASRGLLAGRHARG